MQFKDKVVFITGAASGIGLAAAKTFAQEGAKVVLADINSALGKKETEALQAAGHEVIFVQGNVAKMEDVQRMIQTTTDHFGRLDIGLNNAGIGGPLTPTAHVRPKDWDMVIAVNQNGVFYCMKEQLAIMEKQGSGCIINVSSIAGLRAIPNQIAYAASKHAVIGMTKTAAGEYARKGIRINAICPVFTYTPLVDKLLQVSDTMEEKLVKTIPMRRFGEVEDVVNGITWLASDASSYVTGLALRIDGGQMI